MITLYGRGDFEIFSPILNREELRSVIFNAARILNHRKVELAASLLTRIPFNIFSATNFNQDDFSVLFTEVPLELYEELRELSQDDEGHFAFRQIAEVIKEIGYYIRFIACDLSMVEPNYEWHNIFDSKSDKKGTKTNNNEGEKKLPLAVCAVVNEVISGSHTTLDSLFKSAGAPGDPPNLSHASKWKVWLLKASEDPNTDAHVILGKVIEEFMEVEPPEDHGGSVSWHGIEFQSTHSLWLEKKNRLEAILQKYGLQYLRGGKIIESGTGLASETLSESLKNHNFDTLEIEFRRAISSANEDPGEAITAGCSLLEALFKTYLDEKEIELPSKQTVKPLWNLVQKELGLDPKDQGDADVQRILSGMASIVDGVGALRTHAGSAHGGGKLRYRVKPRHARLLINSAHTLALFLIETWKGKTRDIA